MNDFLKLVLVIRSCLCLILMAETFFIEKHVTCLLNMVNYFRFSKSVYLEKVYQITYFCEIGRKIRKS